jgi:hypothetical protein
MPLVQRPSRDSDSEDDPDYVPHAEAGKVAYCGRGFGYDSVQHADSESSDEEPETDDIIAQAKPTEEEEVANKKYCKTHSIHSFTILIP